MTTQGPSLGHHCGVAAIYSRQDVNIPEKLFFPLFSLQHRGQESAGIAYRKGGHTVVYKDVGMVSAVLSRYVGVDRPSRVGIGHVRYSTHGGNKLENAQPILVTCNKGEIAIAHNGNISNTAELKKQLFDEGSIFQTTSDTELFLHLISRSKKSTFHDALFESLNMVRGAFSMVLTHDDELIAVRDPHGFRPLYIGFLDDTVVIASETCGLDILQVRDYRSVEPGEVIFINDDGVRSEFLPPVPTLHQCVFELIYFARPDSQVFDNSVHERRKKMGAALALEDHGRNGGRSEPIGDIVVSVPDSGNSAALGYSEASGIPFDFGLTRNHYSGRSFIMPTTSEREMAVRMKLHPIKEVIAGKRVVLVDDSLVRGTTAKSLVSLLRDAGAAEIHLRLSSPEILWPCFFGIDIPTRKELISNRMSNRQIAEYVGADSVRFLSIESLKSCLDAPSNYCYSCFSGNYPFPVPITEQEKNEFATTAERALSRGE